MRVKSKKYTGVYLNKLSNGDTSYSVMYKDENKKTIRVTIGKKSEGITENYAHSKRNEFINISRLGEEPPIVVKKKKKNIITLDMMANESYDEKALHNRDHKIAKRRYEMHVSPILGEKDITAITSDDVKKLQKKKAKEFAPKTVNMITGELSTVFTYAINKEIIKSNPTTKVKKLKVDNKRERYLNQEEINRLLEYTKDDEQIYTFVLLALKTGARVGALAKLTARDIDFQTKTINILDEKNNERYTAFLCDDELEVLLLKRKAKRKLDEPILKENNADLYDQLKDRVSNVLDTLFNNEDVDSKHKVVIHTLRHTFASHLAINGTPIFTIQKLLNHKDINMTLRYAKLAPDTGREAVKVLYHG